MIKKRITKDDGRYLIFYRFARLEDSGTLAAEHGTAELPTARSAAARADGEQVERAQRERRA